jgi:BlaI family transcriptional regulator, penicillinase repressor
MRAFSSRATLSERLATNKLVDVLGFYPSECLKGKRLARSKSAILTEAELRIMNVLWDKGPATVHEVLQALPPKPALAYNSVLTIIRILETKGYVKHVKDRRAYIYQPKVDRKDARRFEVRHLVSRFFGDSHELLVLNILEEKNLDSEELAQVRRLLEGNKEQ